MPAMWLRPSLLPGPGAWMPVRGLSRILAGKMRSRSGSLSALPKVLLQNCLLRRSLYEFARYYRAGCHGALRSLWRPLCAGSFNVTAGGTGAGLRGGAAGPGIPGRVAIAITSLRGPSDGAVLCETFKREPARSSDLAE